MRARTLPKRRRGFTVLELLLAMALGLTFCGLILRALALEGPQGAGLARQLRERGWQERTLELIQADLRRAETLRLMEGEGSACGLAGRVPLLLIGSAQGPVTYSLGAPPSAIWRGQVLMRCGPAFGLDGEPSAGQAQNRVVLDALSADGLRIELLAAGLLRLRLEQEFRSGSGEMHRLSSSRTLAAGALLTP